MELPDTLSRAQLPEKKSEIQGLECISMLSFVSVSEQRYSELQGRTKNMHKKGGQTIDMMYPQ